MNKKSKALAQRDREKYQKFSESRRARLYQKAYNRKLNINGSITTDPFNMLTERRRFYQEL